VEWIDVLAALPYVCLNDLVAYEERKAREWRTANAGL
jgi:hypothetical protein